MTVFIIFTTIAYLILIGSFAFGFDRIKNYSLNHTEAKTTFSVVIPFKNEATNISDLLKSILKLKYPTILFEVILVNDESNDDSENIIQQILDTKSSLENSIRIDIKIIENERTTNSPKKDAINSAISKAKFDWIITTDADCIVPNYWLDCFDNFIQNNNSNMVVGPVKYYKIDTFLKRFQALDFLSLIGATIGGFGIKKPFLCNGANLAYNKHFFKELDGFKGNSHIASGDDIFLLEKAIKQQPKNVHFIKSEQSIIKTQPQQDLNSLLSQRIRWAAKTSNYKNLFGKLTGFLVLLMNALIVCCCLFAIMGLLNVTVLGIIFTFKIIVDFLLIYKTARFFRQEKLLSTYFLSSLIYPLFSVYVAFASVFKGYKWKGNYYKK